MHIAEVRIAPDDDFGALLKEMRIWLDRHQFVASTFTYFDLDPGMSIQVSFAKPEEAEVFAGRFGGSLRRKASGGGVSRSG